MFCKSSFDDIKAKWDFCVVLYIDLDEIEPEKNSV